MVLSVTAKTGGRSSDAELADLIDAMDETGMLDEDGGYADAAGQFEAAF